MPLPHDSFVGTVLAGFLLTGVLVMVVRLLEVL
jgi:hypothetical protein